MKPNKFLLCCCMCLEEICIQCFQNSYFKTTVMALKEAWVLMFICLTIRVSQGIENCALLQNTEEGYYDNFVDDYEPCPTTHINQSCADVAGAEARMNCFKCCQSKLHVLSLVVSTIVVINIASN